MQTYNFVDRTKLKADSTRLEKLNDMHLVCCSITLKKIDFGETFKS